MRRRRMAAMKAVHEQNNMGLQISSKDKDQTHLHRSSSLVLVEKIDGLIRVYKDGHVERPQIVPCVGSSLAPDLGVTCGDIIIDKYTNVWARVYVPRKKQQQQEKLPLLVYFHGGGFCVGSASWICYHDFLAKLAASVNCVVVSVNYRLAPENPLPAAYDDGVVALGWLRKQQFAGGGGGEWWTERCDFSRVCLAGDSAGANIAYNVAVRVATPPLPLRGLVLIQPFFGGEARTDSEKYMVQPPRSALTLAASDTYWRLSLPAGADRDHPWCNPAGELPAARVGVLVCVSEMDILRDRNLEFCERLRNNYTKGGGGGGGGGGRKVEQVVSKGVGHAFQILDKSPLSQTRVLELISHINNFIISTCM
ncbi:hypothetical protein ABFS83_12G079900 [Erythranthe nasuta]